MNIVANKTIAVFVSAAFVFTAYFVYTPLANAQSSQDETIAKLLAQIEALTKQVSALSSNSGGSSITTTTNNACSYAWTKNLAIGSSGEDVLRLQRFLNGDSATTVATSGAGSVGSETRYYGPATANAVSRFQEKYASAILSPLGLTKGTGNFSVSTRGEANRLCGSGGGTNTGGSTIPVVGGDLNVSDARQPANGYAVAGAQRVPFTSFTLTAGSNDVRVSGIEVRQVGLSKRDDFDSVALVDGNGVQLGSSRSLNSDKEATVGGRFTVPRGQSVTLTVVGDIGDEASSGIAQLQVTSVEANGQVSGRFPIKGALHAFSDAVTLSKVDVISGGSGNDNLELNSLEDLAKFELQIGSTGNEDAYLKSITFEQAGSIDADDFDNDLELVVDNRDSYRLRSGNDDRYTVVFSGRGYKIEEGDRVDLTIEGSVVDGTSRTVEFTLDDPSDVYVVGADFGYGLPVRFGGDDDGDSIVSYKWNVTGGNGDINRGTALNSSDFNVTYGDNRLIGAFDVEIEGEAVEFEDPEFSVTISGAAGKISQKILDALDGDGDDELSIDRPYLEIDGRKYADAEDFVFKTSDISGTAATGVVATKTLKFSNNFDLSEKRDEEEYTWIVKGDLDTDWPDGTKVTLKLVRFKSAEGVVSGDSYTADGKAFAQNGDFIIESDDVTIEGNLVKFSLTGRTVDETQYVADVEGVPFATVEIDAGDSSEDVSVSQLEVTLEATGTNLEELRRCDLLNDKDDKRSSVLSRRETPKGDDPGTTKLSFNFDRGYEVRAGDTDQLTLVCDIKRNATNAGRYQFKFLTTNNVRYEIGRDSFNVAVVERDDLGETITISDQATLNVRTIAEQGSEGSRIVVATGNEGQDEILVGEIEFEAEQSDVTLNKIVLTGVLTNTASGTLNSAVIESIQLKHGGVMKEIANEVELDNAGRIEFESLDFDFESGRKERVEVYVSVNGINGDSSSKTGISGAQFDLKVIETSYQAKAGVTTEQTQSYQATDGNLNNLNGILTYRATPTVSSRTVKQTGSGTNTKLYEFRVGNDSEEGVYFGKAVLDVTLSGATISNVTLYAGDSNDSESQLASVSGSVSGGEVILTLDDVQRIDSGGSTLFSVYGTLNDGSGDSDKVTVGLRSGGTPAAAAALSGVVTTNNGFVWSPNSANNFGGPAATVVDWFTGASIIRGSGINNWTTDTD